MKLHGTLVDNMEMALASAKRLRGKPVYSDTIEFWSELVRHAHNLLDKGHMARDRDTLRRLSQELATEIAMRG